MSCCGQKRSALNLAPGGRVAPQHGPPSSAQLPAAPADGPRNQPLPAAAVRAFLARNAARRAR